MQSQNRGHQNAVLADLMKTKDICDITISIDCNGQDDINAIDEMIDAFKMWFMASGIIGIQIHSLSAFQ